MGVRRDSGDGRGRPGSLVSGLVVAVGCVLFVSAFVWGAVVYQPYMVPTDSMAPTLATGSRVLAQRVNGDGVRRGDVVVFQDQGWASTPIVKRVVGVGGDRVVCCGRRGRLVVNGELITESYLGGSAGASATVFEVLVPAGRLFVLGDHREDSVDSRAHLRDAGRGSVSRGAVRARVEARAWPPADIGALDRATGFARLPGGISRPGPLRTILIMAGAGAALTCVGAAYGAFFPRFSRWRQR